MVFRPHSAANWWLLPTSVKQYCLEDGIFHPLKVRIHGHIFATMVFRLHSAAKRWLLPTRAKQVLFCDFTSVVLPLLQSQQCSAER